MDRTFNSRRLQLYHCTFWSNIDISFWQLLQVVRFFPIPCLLNLFFLIRSYAFQTPEGWTTEGRYRALGYMRPLAIWAMQWALNPPKIPKQEAKPKLEADSLSRQHAGFQAVARLLKLPKEKDARSVFQVLFDYTCKRITG